MVIMRPDAKKIPAPIDVDLAQIVRTSTLVNFPGSNILPSMSLIQAAINDQARELAKGTLVPTNLVMGHGTNLVLASNNQLSKTIGSLAGLTTSHNGVPVAATVSTNTSAAANNVLGSGPAVSVSSSAQLVSLLGNAAAGSARDERGDRIPALALIAAPAAKIVTRTQMRRLTKDFKRAVFTRCCIAATVPIGHRVYGNFKPRSRKK